jgi:hypothetical protein
MINVPGVTLKDIKITGDLIIGDGVGNGDVTLDGITVTGRTIIRGGGVNSIKIIGNSNLQNIIIARVDGQVRVYAEDGTQIGEVIVDGSDNVTIEGNFGTVTVTAPDITVTATNADIVDATIVGDRSIIMIGDKSTITTATIEGDNAKIITLAGSKIDDIVVNSDGATISGAGEVGTVEANADNTTVTTLGTSVTAATGTTGVTAGTITVTAGTTEIVGGGSSGGGGSHDIAVRAITSADVAVTTGSVIFGYTFTAIGGTVTYADAKDAPYYLNVDTSTVTLTDGSNTSSAVSVNDLEIADDGTVKYTDLVDIQSKFAGLDFVPTEVLIHLVGASSVNSGSDTWTKDVTVTLDAGEVALLAVVTAEGSNLQDYVDVAQALITAFPDGTAKTALQVRINAVQAIINAETLADAKDAALLNLAAAFDLYVDTDYTTDNWTELTGFDTAGTANIGAATDLAGVSSAQTTATEGMAGVATIAETLADAKDAALADLADAFGGYTEGDYTTDNWTALTGFDTAGTANIGAATDLAGVSSAQTTATEGMAGVATIAETLAAAKVTAKADVATALTGYAVDNYTEANWAALNAFHTDGDTAIDGAGDLAAVSTAKTTAINGMDGVTTIAETLAAAKVTAKADVATALTGYVSTNYTTENWAALNAFHTDGDTAIDGAGDLAAVSTAKTTAINGMDGVATIAETLAAAKATALADLAAALLTYTEGNYTAGNWTTLTIAKTDGDTAIDAATDLAGVASAKTTALNAMDAVQTIAQTLAAANLASVATVKGLVAGATYTMIQAAATDEATVKAEIESVISGLALDGVAPVVTKVLYTAALAGDAGTPAGTNGTYTFTVALSKGAATDTTATLTMTVTATAAAYTYTTAGNEVTITGYIGTDTVITIPSTLGGNSVTIITPAAFYGSAALTSVTIPASVTSIGDSAFYNCTGLTEILVNGDNSNYASVDGVLYNKGITVLIQYPKGNTRTSFTIPDSVTTIGLTAFYGSTALTTINFPSYVTSIGASAFGSCTGLTSVIIGSGVTSIGYHAFYGCTSLTSVTIPYSVTSIGDYAFLECTKLTSVIMGRADTTIGNNLMNNNNFRTAYSTGKAGTYTGTLTGVWTRLSSDARILSGTLAGASLAGDSLATTGAGSIGSSSGLTVSVPSASAASAALVLTKGNENSTIKYVVLQKITDIPADPQPADNAAYTGTYTSGITFNVDNLTRIWLMVTAQDGTTKGYYWIIVSVAPLTTPTLNAMVINAESATGAGNYFVASAAGADNTKTKLTFTYGAVGGTLEYVIVAQGAASTTGTWADAPATTAETAELAATATGDLYVRIKAVADVSNASAEQIALDALTVGAAPVIGQSYGGGIIAYIDGTGLHGLIAATNDQNLGIAWALITYQSISVPAPGATGTAIGTGLANTIAIRDQNLAGNNYAAGICDAWVNTNTGTGVYSDWYLPSKDELAKLYAMKLLGFGDFAADYYWSSSESSSSLAWAQGFADGSQIDAGKSAPVHVRAVRAF